MQVQIRENISLKTYNTFGISAVAKYFASFSSAEELALILSQPLFKGLQPKLVLGGGSNILLTKNVDGLVLKNEINGINVINEDQENVFIKVGAGVNWHQFVLYCIEKGYAGVENLALIPGNVGASPMQNIGAYGVEVKDVFHSLEAYRINDNSIQTFSLSDCEFGYRESIFKNKHKEKYVILNVTYRLSKTPRFTTSYGAMAAELERMGVTELSVKRVAQAVINIRTQKLPDWKKLGNAGSFFKNPQVSNEQFQQLKVAFPNVVGFAQREGTKLAAGWLIEQCGWKGHRNGDAGCYEKQALVLVNYGGATGKEIFDLSEEIIKSVAEKFGVHLAREVNIV